MALRVYKPGQGYWTRVLTAVGLGVIALSGAAWLAAQLSAVRIPTPTWRLSVAESAGAPAPGQIVSLIGRESGAAIGTATIQSVEPNAVVVGALPEGLTDLSGVRAITADAFNATVTQRTAIPLFEPIYLQAGAAGIVILLAAAFIYWLVAIKPRPNEFLISVDTEMRKVNWSNRREIIGSTWVVITVCFAIALILWVVDLAFATFFEQIDVINV